MQVDLFTRSSAIVERVQSYDQSFSAKQRLQCAIY